LPISPPQVHRVRRLCSRKRCNTVCTFLMVSGYLRLFVCAVACLVCVSVSVWFCICAHAGTHVYVCVFVPAYVHVFVCACLCLTSSYMAIVSSCGPPLGLLHLH